MIASSPRRQVAGRELKRDIVSQSSKPAYSAQRFKRHVSTGEATEKKYVQTGKYIKLKGDKATDDLPMRGTGNSRRGNQMHKKAGLVAQSRRAMVNCCVRSSLGAPAKKAAKKLLSRPQRKTTNIKNGGTQISRTSRGSRVKKEQIIEDSEIPREMPKKDKRQTTSKRRTVPAHKHRLSRIRAESHVEVRRHHVHTQRRSILHSAAKVKKDAPTNERLASMGPTGEKRDDVCSRSPCSALKLPLRLSRRNAIFNAEEASKDARAAAARVQEMLPRKGYKRVLKPKGKQRRV